MLLQFERRIAQNPALGAAALFSFSAAYFEASGHAEGPELPAELLVLPMVFHQRTSRAIHRMRSASGLLKALFDHPEICIGLQARVEALADTSLDSLSVALSSGLLSLDRAQPWPRYTPAVRKLPPELTAPNKDVAEILAASQRLGWWFQGHEISTIALQLHVRF